MTTSPSQTENCGIAARYYAPPTFTSRDPLFEKYFWLSPYTYCANNPMKYVDPTGCEVEFKGFEVGIQVALKDLNKIAGNLNLEIKDGKLVIGKDGTAVTEYEKRLAEAIKSTEFKSVIEIGDNNGYPGSYLGTELEEDLNGNKQYVSRNGVNICAMQNHEKDKKSSSGLGLLHEITEGYEMAKIAKEKGLEHIDGAWKGLEK